MALTGLSMSPLGAFSGRFDTLRVLFLDPGFQRFLAIDAKDQREMQVQFLAAPGLKDDSSLCLQWEALQASKETTWFRPQEFLTQGDHGILVSWAPPGRTLFELNGPQPDEVYLRWLGEALADLRALHQRSFLHLAQNEQSWILFQGEGEGAEESLGLSDPALFADLRFGYRVRVGVLKAIAPEILNGLEPDERADLYSLACLIVLQRFASQWEGLKSLAQWVDAHRAGRFVEAVPKTETPLNQWLRKMLAVNPAERPRHASEILRGLFPKGNFAPPPAERPQWSYERLRRRRDNVLLSTFYSLIREGEGDFALKWLEEISPKLPTEDIPYLNYLQALAYRRKKDFAKAKEYREKTIATLPERQDKKLQGLLLLEEARGLGPLQDRSQIRQQLDYAWSLAQKLPDSDLQAKVLVERAKHFRAIGDEEKSLEDLCTAERTTLGMRDFLVRGKVLRDLADFLAQYGFPASALSFAEEALREVEAEAGEKARRHIEVGLIRSQLKDFERAREEFKEGKYLFSTLKDLPELIWATAHEIRGLMAEGNFIQARKDLKALRHRAQHLPGLQTFLDFVELELWLGSGECIQGDPQQLVSRFQALTHDQAEELIFRECVWPRALSLEHLSEMHRKGRNEVEAEKFSARAQALRSKMETLLLSKGYQKELPPEPPPAPMPEPPSIPTEALGPSESGAAEHALREELDREKKRSQQWQEENRRLKERVQLMERELDFFRRQNFASPTPGVHAAPASSGESPLPPDLTQAKEGIEKRSIEDALRRHRGNRNLTAQELGIHRRTLFEKLKKYGLEEVNFDPTAEDIRQALDQAAGKKNVAAEILGLSRSSFYRRLKDLGML